MPVSKEDVLRITTRLNQTRKHQCPECTKKMADENRYFQIGEAVPYIIFDASTAEGIGTSRVKVYGVCSSDWHPSSIEILGRESGK